MDNALDIWTNLKNKFSHGDLARINNLQLEAVTLSQGDLNVFDFFTKLCIIWDELENFRPTPTCFCPVKCSCLIPTILAQIRREDHAIQFLRGLNDQFNKYEIICSPHGSNATYHNFFFRCHAIRKTVVTWHSCYQHPQHQQYHSTLHCFQSQS